MLMFDVELVLRSLAGWLDVLTNCYGVNLLKVSFLFTCCVWYRLLVAHFACIIEALVLPYVKS